jgi:hypothetical protein
VGFRVGNEIDGRPTLRVGTRRHIPARLVSIRQRMRRG